MKKMQIVSPLSAKSHRGGLNTDYQYLVYLACEKIGETKPKEVAFWMGRFRDIPEEKILLMAATAKAYGRNPGAYLSGLIKRYRAEADASPDSASQDEHEERIETVW